MIVHFKIEFAGQECDACKEIGYVFVVLGADEDEPKQVCKCCVKKETGMDIEKEMFKSRREDDDEEDRRFR